MPIPTIYSKQYYLVIIFVTNVLS